MIVAITQACLIGIESQLYKGSGWKNAGYL